MASGYGEDPRGAAEAGARMAELTRGKVWRAKARLEDLIQRSDLWLLNDASLVQALGAAVEDVYDVVKALRTGQITQAQALALHLASEKAVRDRHEAATAVVGRQGGVE